MYVLSSCNSAESEEWGTQHLLIYDFHTKNLKLIKETKHNYNTTSLSYINFFLSNFQLKKLPIGQPLLAYI